MNFHHHRLSALSCVLLAAAFSAASAQSAVNVTVDATKSLNPLTRDTVGVYTQLSDTNLLTPKDLGLLRAAGITSFTYPTGWQGSSDAYHWSTNTFSPHLGNADAPMTPQLGTGNDMGHLVTALEKTGITPIIQVNYGSNAKGTGGGEPKEAAAWVAYANAAPDNGLVLGVDSSGMDWKTAGFWAGLRASAPLATDDGYNFLRVNHPEPLRILLWQIGENVAQNGYYGVVRDQQITLDLHAPYPAQAKNNGRRGKVKELSPAFYGERVAEFAAAMKAVDPKIQIGAAFTNPVSDTWAPDWNGEVLKAGCKSIDFVAFQWHPGTVTLPPDYHTMDENLMLHTPQDDFPKMIAETLYQDRKFCPVGKVPRVVLSQFAPVTWAARTKIVTDALFAADTYATLAEAGIANSSWFQLRENGMISKEEKPNPAYYGTQMFHIVAFRPGDALLATTGTSSSLSVHATHRQDGPYGVLLINKDPSDKKQVKVTLNGATLAGTGLRFVYNQDLATKGAGPERSEVKFDGNSITVDVPPYAIVDLLLPAKK